jgi:putative spermidine/putrescine transport system ATP-binding protein
MTVAQNIEYGLRMRHWTKQRRTQRIAEMTELVGLQGLERRLPRELSGGQQQRVALARALAFDPMLLLMDEPLGALDRELRIRMASELRRIHRELGTTIVYVTHDREEALTLSDRVAIMHNGSLEAVDSPEGLYHRPRSSFVARFFGGHNLLEARVTALTPAAQGGWRSEAVCLGQVVRARTWSDLKKGESAHLAVPPRAVMVGARPRQGDLALQGRVIDVIYLGEVVQVTCQLDDSQKIQAHVPAENWAEVPYGAIATVTVNQDRVVLVRHPAAGESVLTELEDELSNAGPVPPAAPGA